MIRNYFVVAFRGIMRNKAYSFINILGLSVGVACCMLLALYIQDEYSYDRHIADPDRVYRIVTELHLDKTGIKTMGSCSPPIAMGMKDELPEIESATRFLGLFGLVEYSVNQRTKEISIRKIFGASVNSLLLLLTRKYFLLVLIAFLVIIPISYVVAQQWLSNFAYHITLSPWMYGKAFTLILLITGFTVSFQSLKAAWTNPANSLRNE